MACSSPIRSTSSKAVRSTPEKYSLANNDATNAAAPTRASRPPISLANTITVAHKRIEASANSAYPAVTSPGWCAYAASCSGAANGSASKRARSAAVSPAVSTPRCRTSKAAHQTSGPTTSAITLMPRNARKQTS
ncbi:hypothetical protein FXN61_36600 [Lentzea sp. PSKA42]|uniref:Uncharacterized protein n=1 Tax=Lentzea indica TaxID=2604800 RepID=A0ABX1FSH5_9PSEU|nr:hypothetical protein [Lentzea indica]